MAQDWRFIPHPKYAPEDSFAAGAGTVITPEGIPATPDPPVIMEQGWIGYDENGILCHGDPNPRSAATPYLRITWGTQTTFYDPPGLPDTIPVFSWKWRDDGPGEKHAGQSYSAPEGYDYDALMSLDLDERLHPYRVFQPD
jgi:hypothetical protein